MLAPSLHLLVSCPSPETCSSCDHQQYSSIPFTQITIQYPFNQPIPYPFLHHLDASTNFISIHSTYQSIPFQLIPYTNQSHLTLFIYQSISFHHSVPTISTTFNLNLPMFILYPSAASDSTQKNKSKFQPWIHWTYNSTQTINQLKLSYYASQKYVYLVQISVHPTSKEPGKICNKPNCNAMLGKSSNPDKQMQKLIQL